MSCLKCNGTPIDVCYKPKVSDQQLDMLHNMIKCLCKCGDTTSDEDRLKVLSDPIPPSSV